MTTQWISDQYGTYNLFPEGIAEDVHLIIQARRPYCDRGHWEFFFNGCPSKMVEGAFFTVPSYYYMRRETAIEEAELWLRQTLGYPSNIGSPDFKKFDGLFNQADGKSKEWSWTAHCNGLETYVDGNILSISHKDEPHPHFVLEAILEDGLDHSDKFPRKYLSLDHAIQEAEDFLAWRILKIPTEIPAPTAFPERNVSPALEEALTGAFFPKKRVSLKL